MLVKVIFQVLVFEGFDELDAIAPYEVLQRAAAVLPDWQVDLVTADGTTSVTGAFGLEVRTRGGTLGRPVRPDVVIVPGGGWVARSGRGARTEVKRGVIPALLAQLHGAGTTLAAVCTGAMLLAAVGLVKNRPAVTHHAAIEELRAAGAEIVDRRVVDAGDIVTAGGVTSGLDLALHLVERFASAGLAREIDTSMEYSRRRPA
jgi:transcriptional regulator GlxA family with amidase domain